MMKMRWLLSCLLLSGLCQAAVLVDDFESYATGSISSPWIVTDGAPTIGQETGGNQYTESYGSYLHLGSNAIPANNTETTVFFRVYELAGTSPDCSVGLSNLADPQGDWNDFEAYIILVNGTMAARNGSSNTTIIYNLAEATWYNIWLVINNSANTYDVYVTTGTAGATAGDREANDFVFRKSTVDSLVTFKIFGRSYAPVRVDDIYISAGTDLSIPSQTAFPPVIVSHPADLSINEGQTALLETAFTSQTAPSADWYKVASPTDQFMDPAHPDIDVQLAYDGQAEEYTSTLTITSVSMSDAGQYYCRVNNESGYPRDTDPADLTIYGLIAHWTLDQENYAGGYYLEEIAGYDAAVNGSPTFVIGADGIAGHAVQISSADGWALCPPFSPAGPDGQMTVSFWADWDQISPTQQDLLAESTDAESLVVPGGLKANGIWQHICTVFDGSTGKLYVDGVVQDQGPWLSPVSSATIHIGAGVDGQNAFTGAMDDMRIYNYPLIDTEVADLYYTFTGQSVCIPSLVGPYDVTGPESLPDCIVDLYDLAAFTGQWMILYDFEQFAGLADQWMSSTLYPN